MTEFDNRQQPNQEQPLRAPAFFKMIGHLAVHAYDHLPLVRRNHPLPLFGVMENELAHLPQPLQPDIPITAQNIHKVVLSRTVATPEHLSFSNKLTRSARMIQFTDRITSRDHAFFDYSTMKTLKDHFVASAEQQEYPLSFDQQLDIALDLSGNDITKSLTNLWFTSRQYARWLDSVSIHNLPDLTPEEISAEMKEWRSAILACKNADEKNFQDTAGDSYYAWTHARARVMYGSKTSMPSRIGKFIFKHGTALNTHRFIKQSIPSDHKIAAEYGNRIGDAILDAIETK